MPKKVKVTFIPGGTGFVSVNDVTRAMTQLMDSDINNERFILVNENLTYSEIFKRICNRLGVTPPDKPIPFWMLELFWRWDGLRSKLRGKRRRLTKNMVKGMRHREIYNNTKIKRALGFTYGNLDETLDFCCEKFKSLVLFFLLFGNLFIGWWNPFFAFEPLRTLSFLFLGHPFHCIFSFLQNGIHFLVNSLIFQRYRSVV